MSVASTPAFRSAVASSSRLPKAAARPSAIPTRYLLLEDIPRTALPTDILRALKDSGAIDPSYPLTYLTSHPPSYPRRPSLTQTVHLTAPSVGIASAIRARLMTHPAFPPLRVKEYNNSPRQVDRSPFPRVSFSNNDAKLWIKAQVSRASQRNRRVEDQGDADTQKGLEMDPLWAMKPESIGRRVVVTGLPGMADERFVRRMGNECGIVGGTEGCMRMPSSPNAAKSIYCFTVDSVSNAYYLQRKLHLEYFARHLYGERFLMRAKVV